MIPKVIHYVWFGGGKKSRLIKHCIKSWRKKLPDYRIIEWNENNFDVNVNQYCREAYEKKKYAFAADYARLYILYHHGGIYMDTDSELFKSLDPFLGHSGFTCFESDSVVALGTVGAEKGNGIIGYMLSYYDGRSFLDSSQPGGIDWTPNTKAMTERLLARGLKANNSYQEIEGFAVYPSIYFCQDGKSENKYATHYFTATWLPKKFQRINRRHRRIGKIKKLVRRIVGEKLYARLKGKKAGK